MGDEDQRLPGLNAMSETQDRKFVLCVRNHDCEDLEVREVYRVLPDAKALRDGYVRVVDESGEDYLYPESDFVSVSLSRKAKDALPVGQ